MKMSSSTKNQVKACKDNGPKLDHKNKTTGPPIDRSAPEKLPKHTRTRIYNGKYKKTARKSTFEETATQGSDGSPSGARPRSADAETQTPAPSSVLPIATLKSDGRGQETAISHESEDSIGSDTKNLGEQQNILATQKDHQSAKDQPGRKPTSDDHELHHRHRESSSQRPFRDDERPASTGATSSVSQNLDADALSTLGELFQWLKLQSIVDQARPPVVCYMASTRLPQPQDYRIAQRGCQHGMGTLRAVAASSTSVSDGQDDLFANQIRARQRAEEQGAAKQSSSRLKGGSRKADKGHGKKSSRTQSARSTPLTSPKKDIDSNRACSTQVLPCSATSPSLPSRRNAISAASTADSNLVMARQTALPSDGSTPAPLTSYLSRSRPDGFILDPNAPLPKSLSPTTCMYFNPPSPKIKKEGPDLSTLRAPLADKTIAVKPPGRRERKLDDERRRNISRARKERRERRKAFRALQKEKAYDGAAVEDDERLEDDKSGFASL